MRALAVALLLGLGMAASAVPSLTSAQGALVPEAAAISASYGVEGWKDEPGQNVTSGLPALPLGTLGVYENPYYSPGRVHSGPSVALGHNLSVLVRVTTSSGGEPGPTENLLISATLGVAGGAIPAKLTRLAPALFRAEFDLDGENGMAFPAAATGGHAVDVDVYRLPSDPLGLPERVGRGTFPIAYTAGSFALESVLLPEAAMAGYSDIGPTNQTLVGSQRVEPLGTVDATLTFPGAAQEAIEVSLHNGARRAVLYEGLTDSSGRVAVRFSPSQALGQNRSALLVLEGHLTGEGARAGNAAVVLPASAHETSFVGIRFIPRGVAGQGVSQVDTVAFTVRDPNPEPDSSSKQGSLFILDRSGNAAAQQPFQPTGFLPGSDQRTAQVPALQIRAMGVNSYRALAMLYDSENAFYSLTLAVRGIGLAVQDLDALPGETASLPITVRNFNSNLDAERDDGLAMTATLSVTGLPGGRAFHEDVTIDEQGERRLEIPVDTIRGVYAVAVNLTDDELETGRAITLRFEDPTAPGFLGIPGAAEALAVLGIAGGALVRPRKPGQ